MRQLWCRLPVVLRAVVVGPAIAALGTVPWALLIAANASHLSAVPWSVPIMAGYLALYWAHLVRACYYEPELTPTYQDFATHYATAILPTRVASPRDKAKVDTARPDRRARDHGSAAP